MINGLTSYTTNCTINCTLPQEHWKFSTAITIGSIASFLSYSLITCLILIPVNVIEHAQTRICRLCKNCIKHGYKKALKNGVLSPFDDTDKLGIGYFYTNYIFVHIVLFLGCLVSSILYIKAVYNQKDSQNQTLIYNLGSCWNNKVNIARIAFHLISQFCAIQSCFIFSKIVYKVTNRLDDLFEVISNLLDFERNPNTDDVHVMEDADLIDLLQSTNSEKIDKGRYIWLQKMDQEFIKKVEPTLNLFGIWFIFHWVSFALTTMLLTGYILQILMHFAENSAEMILKGKLIPDAFTNSEPAIIWRYALNIVFFTLLHAYLYLYPCFRASAITAAREKLIRKISKKRWINVTPSLTLQLLYSCYCVVANYQKF